MFEDSSAPKGFTVVDRRASSMDDDTIVASAEGDLAEAKPAYVEQIERALAEKDRKLRELATELNAVQERVKREASREVERHRRGLLADLLDVADNLDRALGASAHGGSSRIDDIVAGVGMVRDLVIEKLSVHGLARIDALGAKFDPKKHEAQALVPVDDPTRDGVVVDVYREGYSLGGEVVRPAGVAVGRLDPGHRPVSV